jgi:large subunit ribosomal protein L24
MSHVKKGDLVIVLSGSQSGKQGKILELTESRTRAIVEGVNLVKRTIRKSQEKPQGGFVEREAPLHTSKLMLVSEYEARKARRKSAAAS